MAYDFAIGARHWPGVAKLIEECGELQQVLGKLVAVGGLEDHWDGTNLRIRLEEELGDTLAAIYYLIAHNPQRLRAPVIRQRADTKEQRFTRWHEQERANANR